MLLRLKTILNQKEIKSKDLAERVGVSVQTISYICNGKVSPSLDLIEKIANALDIPIWQLFVSPEDITYRKKSITAVSCPHCGHPLTIKIE